MWILTETDTRTLVNLDEAIALVEEGLVAVARGDAVMFPPLVAHGADLSTRFGAKAGVYVSRSVLGVKIGSYWPANVVRGLPAHGSTTLLLNDETGYPSAIVAATHLNALRTAAADAVAVRQLAAPDAGTVALVGAGHQAWWELQAVSRVRTVREVRVWSRDPSKAQALAVRAQAQGLRAVAHDLESTVRGAQIIITATASRAPLVRRGWVSPGAHISAMGADGRGKQELETELLATASLFADLPAQSVAIGEFQHGSASLMPIRPIGDVVDGRAPGRVAADEITIFDSSGIAVQDLSIAAFAVERARERGLGRTIALTDH